MEEDNSQCEVQALDCLLNDGSLSKHHEYDIDDVGCESRIAIAFGTEIEGHVREDLGGVRFQATNQIDEDHAER